MSDDSLDHFYHSEVSSKSAEIPTGSSSMLSESELGNLTEEQLVIYKSMIKKRQEALIEEMKSWTQKEKDIFYKQKEKRKKKKQGEVISLTKNFGRAYRKNGPRYMIVKTGGEGVALEFKLEHLKETLLSIEKRAKEISELEEKARVNNAEIRLRNIELRKLDQGKLFYENPETNLGKKAYTCKEIKSMFIGLEWTAIPWLFFLCSNRASVNLIKNISDTYRYQKTINRVCDEDTYIDSLKDFDLEKKEFYKNRKKAVLELFEVFCCNEIYVDGMYTFN
jgi:hypothetical protein